MIWGVEGNVNVGKTTFIRKIERINKISVIEETKFKADMKPIKRQLYYINNEIKKCQNIDNKHYIMDRTILSVYLYTIIANEFSVTEKNRIIERINMLIEKKKILIPNELFFILYPYDLINRKDELLGKEKNTQRVLVDYNYYLRYNLFFSNVLKGKKIKLIETKENRQIVLSKCDSIYLNLKKHLPINSEIVLIDGAPAIGKTTIGRKQKKLKYIEEFKYKKYTLEDYSNQIESIVERINCLSMENILVDTSFLMGITHLFYSHKNIISQEEKITIINRIIEQIPMYLYVSKIIYLYTKEQILLLRKKNDKNKKREHFYDNIKYLKEEKNFYEKLNDRMGMLSNIHIIDAGKTTEEILCIINSIENKEVLLVDLFYYILECIKKGEI